MSTRCDCAPEEVEGALPDYEACPELALAALITLMTSFPSRRSPAIARSVLAHLEVISRDADLDAVLRECALQLMGRWAALEQLCEPEGAVVAGGVRILN
ncbi:MAG: hypothetical protein PHI64_14080 [Zoogloea sp.]|uniref:hypothetical protein n=1 Tax=Zoogloea sp. TaxID=49181 RepID=UPI002619AE6F|nr:hypothetical protein [Zoogloea sp.]MDD2990081.1 hypothetical protein [Zoogloea sp.]